MFPCISPNKKPDNKAAFHGLILLYSTLDEEYAKRLKSPDADLKNSGGREGGTCTAGMFLKAFVADDMPWAHMDIAGTAYNMDGSDYYVPGATGFGIRLTIDWLRGL